MTCPACGQPTRAGAAFCGECGETLVRPMVAVRPTAPASGLISPPSFISAPAPEPLNDETRASPRRARQWLLTLPDSSTRTVSGIVLIGRDPAPRFEYAEASLLTIDDPGHSLSKTHAVLTLDSGGLWIEDLDSTNGVVVVDSYGVDVESQPGIRIPILSGSEIELGQIVLAVTLV